MHLVLKGYSDNKLFELGFHNVEGLALDAAIALDSMCLGQQLNDKDRLSLRLAVQWIKENGEETQGNFGSREIMVFYRIWKKYKWIPSDKTTLNQLAVLVGKKCQKLARVALKPDRIHKSWNIRRQQDFCLELSRQISARTAELRPARINHPFRHYLVNV